MVKTEKEAGVSAVKKILLAACGLIVGGVNGLFGGGGGMIAVPALTGLIKIEQKEAHATAILVILPVSAVSAAVYSLKGGLDFSVLTPCVIGVTAGGAVGAKLMNKLSSPALQLVFAAVMLAAGLKALLS